MDDLIARARALVAEDDHHVVYENASTLLAELIDRLEEVEALYRCHLDDDLKLAAERDAAIKRAEAAEGEAEAEEKANDEMRAEYEAAIEWRVGLAIASESRAEAVEAERDAAIKRAEEAEAECEAVLHARDGAVRMHRDDGAKEERAAIVAWLRTEGDTDGRHDVWDSVTHGSAALGLAADLIEAGAHLAGRGET